MAKSLRNVLFVLAFALFFVFTFAACGNGLTKFEDNPSANDMVTGNGSLAVTKGSYLYFANGFTSYEDVGEENTNGKATYSALYRVKLNDQGVPTSVYDEDDKGDGSRAIKDVDILAPKVVGFESVGLYIFGDYIYFATPHNGLDSELKIQSKKVDFFRTKIDRSAAPEHLYTTKTETNGTNISYNMLEVDGNVFLTILDDTDLQIIKIDKNGGKNQTKASENVSSVAFANYASSTTVSAFNQDVYYTRSLKDSDAESSGNVLCKFNLKEFKNYDKVFADGNSTITLKKATKDRIFYEKSKKSDYFGTAFLFSATSPSDIRNSKDVQLCYDSYTDFCVVEGTTLIVTDGSDIALLSENQTLYSGSSTLLGVEGQFVYFLDTTNNEVKRVDFVNKTEAESVAKKVMKASGSGDAKTRIEKRIVSVNGGKVFYLCTDHTNDSVYLHMVDTENENKDYFVGVLEKKDYDEKSDN